VVVPHPTGIHVLISPRGPEDVEAITARHIERLLDAFTLIYDYIIVDCQSSYDERMLVILERADAILLVIKPEVGCVKNMAVFSELAVRLGFPFEKIHIVLNRSGTGSGIDAKEIERIFRRPIAFHIGSGGRSVVVSVNRGVPLTIEHPNHAFSLQVGQIADYVVRELPIFKEPLA
jgi:pilus assembly protein CpaE